MKSALKNSMNQLKTPIVKKQNSLEFIIVNEEKVPAAFTISEEVYDHISRMATLNKISKTKVAKHIFDKTFDDEKKELIIDIEKKPVIKKKLMNIRIDKDLNKTLLKLSKDTNKSFGEIFEDLYKYMREENTNR